MRKYTVLILAILSTVLLSSCFESQQPTTNIPTQPTNSQDIPSDTSPTQDYNSGSGTITSTNDTGSFDSVKDAVLKWISLKCSYTDNDKSVTTLYIKDDNISIEWSNDNKEWSVNGVIKGDTIYMWNNEAWMKLNLSTSPKDSIKIGKQSIKSQDDLLDILNTQKDGCSKTDIDSTKFDLPSNVEFKELKSSDIISDSGSGS